MTIVLIFWYLESVCRNVALFYNVGNINETSTATVASATGDRTAPSWECNDSDTTDLGQLQDDQSGVICSAVCHEQVDSPY